MATIVGAVLIVGSGLYIMLRAHRSGDSVTDNVPTALPADPPL
jgi:uncharacterized membrane protein